MFIIITIRILVMKLIMILLVVIVVMDSGTTRGRCGMTNGSGSHSNGTRVSLRLLDTAAQSWSGDLTKARARPGNESYTVPVPPPIFQETGNCYTTDTTDTIGYAKRHVIILETQK